MALVTCPECGAMVSDKASCCARCGCPMHGAQAGQPEQQHNTPVQTVIVERPKSNGVGVAGFVLSILALLFSWAPVAGWLIWVVGFILSCVGMFRQPRGLAVAGFIISIIGILLICIFIGAMASLAVLDY